MNDDHLLTGTEYLVTLIICNTNKKSFVKLAKNPTAQ